jgi:hypothetical protein
MPVTFFKSAGAGLGAIGLALSVAGGAHAEYLPNVSNLNFVDYTGATPKNYFTSVNPVGWTGGSGRIFIDAPGAADDGSDLSVYSPFPTNSPVGWNFVEADGNPTFESGFNQLITGLTPGHTYTSASTRRPASRWASPTAWPPPSSGSCRWERQGSASPAAVRSISSMVRPTTITAPIRMRASRQRR